MSLTRKPEWFRKTISLKDLTEMRKFIKEYNLNTVCEEAACPNRGECYKDNTLTVMILGQTCTRNCKFCNVEKKKPDKVDEDEPYRVAEALSKLNLDYVVITSVTRDDLKDGGAEHFAKTITEFKKKNP
ncbi:MAG: lipoyl synthase, partial [Nanoarchaeota archaeon]|nr:lipoyl synthase [Nanoarchaeota archaeon]